MLSRVAESLYWTARYVERAEDTVRLLDVHFHALLDAQVGDRDESWQRLVATLGDEPSYREHFDEFTAANAAEWILWHDANPNAVARCVSRARENARSVREQISSEMWEAVNRLFLLVGSTPRRSTARGPHAFFERIRAGSHQFQGTAAATMEHGEPYEFIRLGLHLERASTTVRVVQSRYPVAWSRSEDDPARAHELVALLKSCSAFEAYVRRHGLALEPLVVLEELLRSEDHPRSASHCLRACLEAVDRISGHEGAQHRVLGRLCADLEYGEVVDPSGPGVHAMLAALLGGLHEVGDALVRAYFASRGVPVATLLEQEAQQQQCG